MKKAIVLVMALLMVTCVFAGCGEETKAPATEPETVNVPKDAAVITAITSGEVYGKDVSTFMADVTIKNNKASGTLPYVTQYSGYTAAQGDLEGKMVSEYVSTLDRFRVSVAQIKIINSPTSPYFMVVETK